MELETGTNHAPKIHQSAKKVKPEKVSVLKKLDAESVRLLRHLKEKVNKKGYGRKVRDGEIISLSLTLIGSEQISKLQENSYSETDRLHLAYEDYVKDNGRVTLDQFIGMLIRGQISQDPKNSLEK